MRFIRNWVVPFVSTSIFALLGLAVLGLPGVSLVRTIDGRDVSETIPAEEVSAILAEGKRMGSYLDFYGIGLPGQPLYWAVGVIGLMMWIGYRLGALAKTPRPRS